MDPQNPGLKTGDRISGFEITKIVELPEIRAFFYELFHPASGARHIHISNKDQDNTFSVAFKTVPADSTGVAHILEHTVLCGSRKYPVRDPFFSMIKRSLNTFMNALTASDWTMYPFSTHNQKDYFNLMSVYLDAAFFPKIDPLSFKQEGHRLEFEPVEASGGPGRLVYKGVVYNEMKGAMSSPDQVMSRSILNALYPDTTYGFNSGGEPAEIPKLTHDQLIAFHRHHYHPSNAFFYTYGNLPLETTLKFIEENALVHFDRMDPKTDVMSQPRWERPRTATYYYPVDENDDSAKKCQVCLAWLTSDIREAFDVLVLNVLEQVLVGNAGSPLRQALIESELGSTLSDGTGFDGENKDTMFACGLKDVDLSSADAIEKIILDTLAGLVKNGVDREMVESAIHQIEFHHKEVSNSPYPYGIKLLLRLSGSWFHHGDPMAALKFDALIQRLFEELDKGPFLENQIQKHFLDNPHRIRLTLAPDPMLAEKEALRVQKELEIIQNRLTEPEIDAITAEAEALVNLQESREDIDCLPTLQITDIPPDIPTVSESDGYTISATCYELPTSGIFYLTAAIGLGPLPADLMPLMPVFCHSLLRCGTAKHTYAEIAHLLDLYTGGMGLSVVAGTRFDKPQGNDCLPMISFSAKCLSRNIEKMVELVRELLCEFAFTDHQRLKHLLLEYRSDMESAVVSNGHRYAISLASRTFSEAGALNENWHGIHQLKSLKKMTDGLTDETITAIATDLSRIAACLLKANNMRIGLIGEAGDLKKAVELTKNLENHLGATQNAGFTAPVIPFQNAPVREGWSTSSSVSFVASVFETKPLTHEHAPALAAISKMLRSLFLHREIREKGGAYGGFASYQPENGLFCFGSYRDPHIVNTLNVYDAAARFITSGDFNAEDIKEAILQVCADIDRPDTPNSAAQKAFYRKLTGLTDDIRKTFKERLLMLDQEKVLKVAQLYFGPDKAPSSVAVISSEDALKNAVARMTDRPLSLHRI
ncbi:MAG: peptidase M16 [Desulfobacteraceae bacterium]|nr:MAG: peptidase M16 [Desulfobacteraceae bacterium]